MQNEVPTQLSAWKDREDESMAFEIVWTPQEIGDYVFFPVRCDAALEYREQLGLPREPTYPLHLTIGNLKPASGSR